MKIIKTIMKIVNVRICMHEEEKNVYIFMT